MDVSYRKEAERDLEQIYADYAAISEDVAILMAERFESFIERLERSPHFGTIIIKPDTRRSIILRTPYVAAFIVRPPRVVVLCFRHGARRWPEKTIQRWAASERRKSPEP